VDTQVSLALRSFDALLHRALSEKREGDVVLREQSGATHRVTVRGGYVVRVRVSGRFDPILAELRRAGALSPASYVRALEGLGRTERRAGQLAIDVGLSQETVARALAAQTRRRLGAILARALAAQTRRRLGAVLARALEAGRDAWLEARKVRADEVDARIGLGELSKQRPARKPEHPRGGQRRCAARAEPRDAKTPRATEPHARTARDRRALRKLAFALHPDRHAHLSKEARAALAEELARATAAFHGLSSR
jgi:hypothetical protein